MIFYHPTPTLPRWVREHPERAGYARWQYTVKQMRIVIFNPGFDKDIDTGGGGE
jgi:hypothetical protein